MRYYLPSLPSLLKGGLLAISLGIGVAILSVWADADEKHHAVKLPEPRAHYSATQECVEPEDVIRKMHGALLKRQREATMHQGIRTDSEGKLVKHSLVGCIDCHVTPDAQGNYPDVATADHFCNACHVYAGVTLDCFQCHAARPGEAVLTSVITEVPPVVEPPPPVVETAAPPVETVVPPPETVSEPIAVPPPTEVASPPAEGNATIPATDDSPTNEVPNQ